MEHLDSFLTRRQLLADSARYAILAGIAVVTGELVWRRATAPEGQTCSFAPDCRQCSALVGCGLPCAVETRKSVQGDDHG